MRPSFRSVIALPVAFLLLASGISAQESPSLRLNMSLAPLLVGAENTLPRIVAVGDAHAPMVGQPFEWVFEADRDVTWSVVEGPGWISLVESGRTATLAGTPLDGEVFSVVIAADAGGRVERLTVGPYGPEAPVVATGGSVVASARTAFSPFQLAATGGAGGLRPFVRLMPSRKGRPGSGR